MINIDLSDQFSAGINTEILKRVAETAIKDVYFGDEVDLSIVITSDQVIKDLNSQFRGINTPTDVLSFSSDEVDPDNGHRYIGDVIISQPRALEQALNARHPQENEISILLVHGILHLFGYDHRTRGEKSEMWNIQNRILTNLGYTINKLPE